MRIFAFLGAAVLAAGCLSGSSARPAHRASVSPAAAAVALPRYGSSISLWDAVGDRIQTTVTGVTDPLSGAGMLPAPAGTRWAAAEVRLTDSGPSQFDGAVQCQVLTGGTPLSSTTSGIRHPQSSESVSPGQTLVGRLVFAVPAGTGVIGVRCALPGGDAGTWWP